jgi:hypothetical protein
LCVFFGFYVLACVLVLVLVLLLGVACAGVSTDEVFVKRSAYRFVLQDKAVGGFSLGS